MTPFAGIGVNLAFEEVMYFADVIIEASKDSQKDTFTTYIAPHERAMFVRENKAQVLTYGTMQDILFTEGAPRSSIRSWYTGMASQDLPGLLHPLVAGSLYGLIFYKFICLMSITADSQSDLCISAVRRLFGIQKSMFFCIRIWLSWCLQSRIQSESASSKLGSDLLRFWLLQNHRVTAPYLITQASICVTQHRLKSLGGLCYFISRIHMVQKPYPTKRSSFSACRNSPYSSADCLRSLALPTKAPSSRQMGVNELSEGLVT
ncbi:hypothetical protein K432DRAFT_388975 [Lepidopterella palustris CBS 459.81]|uniref:Uncharacterized protein n=1 Tax=Lepidopterella palustris CBS 459.81 TaxID=1314670 RepID=A0A8E2JJS3_9PEZI|nr:hypothetical protein K432DRAFT_388975 [Lepidopterella palustris CBS 459.81]